jgi:hypothetical protein
LHTAAVAAVKIHRYSIAAVPDFFLDTGMYGDVLIAQGTTDLLSGVVLVCFFF